MAVTKTKFINYIRCPRYVALDKIHKEKLDADITCEEYLEEEKSFLIRELLSNMYSIDENAEEEDLIDVVDKHLEAMLPYYKELELLAGAHIEKHFGGQTVYSKDTFQQESFDFLKDGIRYLCYVDILNESHECKNIIEVKATTTKKFLKLGYTKDKQCYSIFYECNDGILRLAEDIDPNFLQVHDKKKYYEQRKHLTNKYDGAGRYVYDLALQRYIIENDLKDNGQTVDINNYRYYLAVLNCQYVFDGLYENGKPVYKKDHLGNELISLIDLTTVTKEMQKEIEKDEQIVRAYITNVDASKHKLGSYCEYKKTTKCKFIPICFKEVLIDNSILNYTFNHCGFKDQDNICRDRFELIEDGYYKMVDLPDYFLTRKENQIQKQVVKNNVAYINKDKIKSGIKEITYPIYHLDFETFNCPMPRLRGEKAYQQSVFQFSLHIERNPGVCDKEKDHYEFLAEDHSDQRETLIKKMIEYIDTTKPGTILVYNETFEKTRLKELSELFPQYKKELFKMIDMIFDLFFLIRTNTNLYKLLGYSEEEAKIFNYYHPKLNGSFSIKKVLPIFTALSYKDLEVGNGMEAVIAYASFDKLSKIELKKTIYNLKEYCKQDTWAMVEILKGLKNVVK